MFYVSPYRQAKNAPVVTAVPVARTNITDYVNLKGTVVELDRHEIYPQYMSRVKSINVSQGDKVFRGDILAVMETVGVQSAASVFYAEAKNRLSIDGFAASSGQPSLPFATDIQTGEEYIIISPIDGVIMDVYCTVGESLSGIFPCIAVSDMTRLGIEAEVSENNVSKLKSGMGSTVTLPAVSGRVYSAKVSSVAPYASAASFLEGGGEVKSSVELEITNPDSKLRPGFSASAKIRTDYLEDRIILPYNCIDQLDDKEYVMVINGDMTLSRRFITTDRELDKGLEVISGLDGGEYVVENPAGHKEGERVKVS